jgi:uncharacterized protein (DUF2147 family)
MMKALFAAAVVLCASSAAQAQYKFDYNGQTIQIDPDRGTVSIPGVYDNTGEKAKRPRRDQDTTRKQPPRDAKSDSRQQASPQAAPADDAAASSAPPVQPPVPAPANATATVAPSDAAKPPASLPAPVPLPPERVSPPPSAAAPAAGAPAAAAPAAAAAPRQAIPPQQAALPTPPVPAPAASAAPSLRDPNSPVGVWLTEEKQGRIRIEPCGANLCGYAYDAKSNQNREQILIDMRPGQSKDQEMNTDKKWSGRIFDPDSGSTYESTIAIKGPDSLRVQGCAMGGMFCGGQTWTRVN